MPALDDVAHDWGDDLQTSPTGDLLRVNGSDRTAQRVVRRIMTNENEYLAQPAYGGSAGAQVGAFADAATIEAVFAGQMQLEAAVARSPAPTITVTKTTTGVAVAGTFTPAGETQPVPLSFEVDR